MARRHGSSGCAVSADAWAARLMCGCSRILLADRTPAILVVATEAASKRLSLSEQAQRLLTGADEPLALFYGRRRAAARDASGAGQAWPRGKPRRSRGSNARRHRVGGRPRRGPAWQWANFRLSASVPVHRRPCWRLSSRQQKQAVPAEAPLNVSQLSQPTEPISDRAAASAAPHARRQERLDAQQPATPAPSEPRNTASR